MDWTHAATIWAIVALLLIAGEVLAPGAFLLWLGIAAAAVAAIVFVLPDLSLVWQMVAFAALAGLSIVVGRRAARARDGDTDRPTLNRRAEQLVGLVVPLAQAIVDGHGRVQIADAFWDVAGPDLPAGTRVRVIGTRGMTLLVEPQG